MSRVASLRASGFRAKKSFGQNFLVDANVTRAIAEVATRGAASVVEIGPGTGALTEELLRLAPRVTAVELDRELVAVLREAFSDALASAHFTLIEGDATTIDLATIAARQPAPCALVGNLPYAVTGQLLEAATASARSFARATFMIQREVADRLVASPGTKDYGALSVFVQAAYRVERERNVPPECFWPRPDVMSTVVSLVPHATPRAEETNRFREAVKRAFEQRRKTLRNAWRNLFGWSGDELEARALAAGVDLQRRGETLSVEEFARIAADLERFLRSRATPTKAL